MENRLSVNEIKGIVRRRAKLFLQIFSLIMIIAVALALALPPIYRSQAVILIEGQQIPDEYVKSTITSYPEQRLEMITREIIRYSVLKEMIEELDLYSEYRKDDNLGAAVQKMKESVQVEPISSKVGVKSYTAAFNLSYENEDPQKAYAVTDRLSHLYLAKETESREKQAAATTGFLQKEMDNLKKVIDEHENKISDFKQGHIGELPESSAVNASTLQRLEREAEQIDVRIRSLEDRKIYLRGQLASIDPLRPIETESGQVASNPQERLKTLRLELIRAQSRLSEKHPDVRKLKSEISELERLTGQVDTTVAQMKQLNALRNELKELKGSKGAKHPDVIALSRQIDESAKGVDAQISKSAMTNYANERPDNPAYINLYTQVVSTDLEINNLKDDLSRTRELIEDYQRRVENAPIVEREFNELTMDYQSAKARYDDIAGKLLQARVAQEMEIQRQGEHFTITDRAFVPTQPAKPNRLAIMLLGFVLATGAGLAGAAFRETTDHTVKGSEDFREFEGVDLLAVLPYTSTPEELRQQRFKWLFYSASCLGLLIVVLVAVDQLLLPLGELISIIIERLASI